MGRNPRAPWRETVFIADTNLAAANAALFYHVGGFNVFSIPLADEVVQEGDGPAMYAFSIFDRSVLRVITPVLSEAGISVVAKHRHKEMRDSFRQQKVVEPNGHAYGLSVVVRSNAADASQQWFTDRGYVKLGDARNWKGLLKRSQSQNAKAHSLTVRLDVAEWAIDQFTDFADTHPGQGGGGNDNRNQMFATPKNAGQLQKLEQLFDHPKYKDGGNSAKAKTRGNKYGQQEVLDDLDMKLKT